MAQKSNLITVRKKNNFLCLYNFNNKIFILGFQLLTELKQLLIKKNIILLNEFVNVSCNKLQLNGSLFFKYSKVKLLNRKKKKFNEKSKFVSYSLKNRKVKILFQNISEFLKINLLNLNFVVLNNKINKDVLLYLFNSLKFFLKSLFNRRINLFVDFIKLVVLCCFNYIKADILLKKISKIFCSLQKRSHGIFFVFLQKLFNILVFELKNKFKNIDAFKGIKFIIKGRIKGKPRSSLVLIQKGNIPIQSIDKNIEYFSTHNYTPHYGVFGFKIWILN